VRNKHLASLSRSLQRLAYFALNRPDATAIKEGPLELSYGQLATRVAQFVEALRSLDIARGLIVGIETECRWLHWVLILACDEIGAPTLSFSGNQLSNSGNLLVERCDFIFSSTQERLPHKKAIHCLNEQWVSSVIGKGVGAHQSANGYEAVDPSATCHFGSSSGTTNAPKILAFSYKNIQARIDTNVFLIGMHTVNPRHITVSNFFNLATFVSTHATLQMGGSMIFSRPETFYEEVNQHNANFSLMVAGDFAHCVNNVPEDFSKPDLFKIDVRGGTFSSALRRSALDRLASCVSEVYSLTETGNVAFAENDDAMILLPGVSVATLDERGVPVAQGEPGTLWVKSDTVMNEYFENPILSAPAFRNGWFNTCDLGIVLTSSRLTVIGRTDDLLNIGGNKINPYPLENGLKSINGVHDVVVVCVNNANGIGQPCVAVEAKSDIDTSPISELALRLLPIPVQSLSITIFPSLPRTESGKIKRRSVLQQCQSAFDQSEKLALARLSNPGATGDRNQH
jgi:acyl-CoA synthetase (AMP-forming)/AMP-acid ligase II